MVSHYFGCLTIAVENLPIHPWNFGHFVISADQTRTWNPPHKKIKSHNISGISLFWLVDRGSPACTPLPSLLHRFPNGWIWKILFSKWVNTFWFHGCIVGWLHSWVSEKTCLIPQRERAHLWPASAPCFWLAWDSTHKWDQIWKWS